MSVVGVIGATGRQGLAQIKQLRQAGYKVRGLSRQENPKFLGINGEIESSIFDLENESTLTPALRGCDVVFYTHPLSLRTNRSVSVDMITKACREAGVTRIVHNTSSWIPDKPGDAFSYAQNLASIQSLWSSGIPSTVFGAVLFMDNFLTDWARPFLTKERRYIYPHAPTVGANWISLDDVGKIMVASIERPDMVGSWMNIGGPERLCGPDVAEILSEALGYKIAYDPCPEDEFGKILVSAMGDGLPENEREAFAVYISDFYKFNNSSPAQPFSVNTKYMMERLPEIKLEPMLDWAKRQDRSDGGIRPSAG